MQCCAADRTTFFKQETTNTQTLINGEGEGMWILLFSEVTLFEYLSVSTILSPIVDLDEKAWK